MSEKLLPCPFCGDESTYNTEGYIECAKCCALGPMGGESRAKAWNTRSNPSHAQLATARSALEKAATWLEGWASAEPYLSEIRSTLSTLAQEPAGQSEWKRAPVLPTREELSDLFIEKIRLVPVNPGHYSVVADANDEAELVWKVKPESEDAFLDAILALLPAGSASPGGNDEPVAWQYKDSWKDHWSTCNERPASAKHRQVRPLYAHPTVKVSGDAAEWQPIETAPKDGTSILATGGGLEDKIEVVFYIERVGAWETAQYTLDDRDDEPQGYNRPTHWMPLPALPTTPAQSERQRGGGV